MSVRETGICILDINVGKGDDHSRMGKNACKGFEFFLISAK
jgi:hypothetical protein